MRVAVISDIHGNLEALTRVIGRTRAEGVDAIVCLGDIVGYGPFPNECIDLVCHHCGIIVQGNHDAGASEDLSTHRFNSEGKAAITWTREILTNTNRAFLQNLPVSVVSGDMTFAHASPREPENWEYIATWNTAAQVFGHFTTDYCCIGHTHIPVVIAADGKANTIRRGHKHLINAGSVGQPRDGNPRAAFALLDTSLPAVSIIRVEYDVSTTATAIRNAGLPEFLAKRLEHGI